MYAAMHDEYAGVFPYPPKTGHLSDGSSVQRHSVGSLYPGVIFQQETPEGVKTGLIHPKGFPDGKLCESWDEAIALAEELNKY